MTDRIWRLIEGDGPVVAMAIHDGHDLREDVAGNMALSDEERLREEDPFTSAWAEIAPTRIIVTRSRFEVDLNRPRESAVYRTEADAWGLRVWERDPEEEMIARSLEEYDLFYRELARLFELKARQHGRFVVLDLHSYCHMRQGPEGPAADVEQNPQINLGTGTMEDRERWSPIIDAFVTGVGGFDFPGGRLDVRENVKFRGGECARWAHETFPDSVCVLSVEVKKFFMDEWSGVVDNLLHGAVGEALRVTLPRLLKALGRLDKS